LRSRPLASLLLRLRGRRLAAPRRTVAGIAGGALVLGLVGAGLTAAPSDAALSDGLVLWYKLDETSGTTAKDASGNGRDGTVNGTATWGGPQGLAFDGRSTYVKVPDNIMKGLSSISVDTDVLIDPAQAAPYFIFGFGNTTGGTGDGYLFATGNVFRASIASGNWSTEQNTTTGTALGRGGWKHLTYTQTGSTGILYEDGTEVARNSSISLTPGSIGGGTTTADYIGKSNYASDNLLNGKVRNFRVYDRALGQAEITELATPVVTDSLAQEKAALTLGDTSAVTVDLALPTTGSLGSKITWSSSDPAIVDTTGKVSRPANGAPSAKVTLTATLAKGGRTDTKAFTVTVVPQASEATVAQEAAAALVVRNVDDVRGNLTLPTTGTTGTTVTWASSAPSVIKNTGEVTRPAAGGSAATVTLTATVTYRTATATRAFTATVPALPAPAPKTGYMFSYFTGEGSASGEQLYFALSRGNDALKWRELNAGKPVLTSSLGEKGVRDPFITRSPEGDKFYLIATDLRIFNGNGWDAAQRTGSTSLAVWESTDLVHWSNQRLVKVSPDTAGNTWAPEAFWDRSIGAYVVYWASKVYAATDTTHSGSTHNKMMYATTRDFWTFSEPKIWKDPGFSVIDSTVAEQDGTYYRFTKDERNNSSASPCSKFIIEEKSTSLLNTNWDFVSECIGSPALTAGEGPTVFKANDTDKWYLFIDEFGGRGYVPFSSTSIGSGKWTMEPSYSLPASPRHGTVMGVTQAEYQRLLKAYASGQSIASIVDTAVDTVVGTAPALPATVNVTFDDASTGTVPVTWDPVPASAYATPGTFTVLGAVADSSLRAKATVTVQPAIDGLLLRYSFDEGGGTVARDTSGHGYNGTYVNSPSFGTGVKNGGLVLPGGANSSKAPYVTIPQGVLKGTSDITVSSWVKWTSSAAANQWLFGLGTDSSKYLFTSPNYGSSAAVRAAITTGSWQTEQVMQAPAIVPGTWTHLAVTIDSTTRTGVLYVNGAPVATNTAVTLKPSDLYDPAASVSGYVGKSFYSADPYLGASVDDFRIYSTALSPDDVAVLAGNSAAITGAKVTGQKIAPIVYGSASTVTLPMTPGSDLTSLAPTFTLSKGATISPASGSTHDFTKPVTYTVTGSDGTVRTWTVKAAILSSPVIPGLYADPNIAVFGDTYWIYPTTDGYDGWSATQFHAFSSKDLVNWTDHGVVLDLGPDVAWADKNAWAPTIAYKNGKYYFYFCAEQSIGVAVADSPAGPFKDALGKPLVAKGAFSGQMIDPQVFHDDDGSDYLYWGNGGAYVVKLGADMVSFDASAVKTITPAGYNEGAFVFKRKGIYYFSWSENDTRDEDYRVAYAVGTSPYGPFSKQGVILSKDLTQGIKGTGHHSVVQVPGTDDWYIAYHRFAIPNGDGTHRETTIDRLTFSATNTIDPVVPTLTGVAGEKVPDVTAPVATATISPATPPSGWHTGAVKVTVTARDDREGPLTPEAAVTGPGYTGEWAPLSGPLTLSADGRFQVDYRVVDGSGNVSVVKSVTIKIDTTAPVSKASANPAARTLTLTAADAASGVAKVQYSLNGWRRWQTYTGPVDVGRSAVTVSYRAIDVAGNVETTNTVIVPAALAASTTKAVIAPPVIRYGQRPTVKVTVSGTRARIVPTGTVRVLAGPVQVGWGRLNRGQAMITLARNAPVGTTPLVVRYDGDARYDTSSTTVRLTVLKAPSVTSAAAGAKKIRPGKAVKVGIKVVSTTRVPVTGPVRVRVVGGGYDLVYTARLDANGKAVVTIGPFLKRGVARVFVSYGGSSTVQASWARAATIVITR
jgi:large repetitive protein